MLRTATGSVGLIRAPNTSPGDLRECEFNPDKEQRSREAHNQDADRVRQPDQNVVEPAEGGGQDEKDGNKIESGKHAIFLPLSLEGDHRLISGQA